MPSPLKQKTIAGPMGLVAVVRVPGSDRRRLEVLIGEVRTGELDGIGFFNLYPTTQAAQADYGRINTFDKADRWAVTARKIEAGAPGTRSRNMARKKRRKNPTGQLVAAWSSKGGRYWLKLYRSGDGTYSYQTDNGGGWGFTAAKIKKIVRDQLSFMPSKMRRVKVARTRNPGGGRLVKGPGTHRQRYWKTVARDVRAELKFNKKPGGDKEAVRILTDYLADVMAHVRGESHVLEGRGIGKRRYYSGGRYEHRKKNPRRKNAAGYQNLRNIPPHRKGRYPNPALTKTQIQNLWTINHLNIRRMSAIIRRGDKQAAALLRKGLVRIERQATYQTPGGKLGTGNVFRLTAKGKQALGSYEP